MLFMFLIFIFKALFTSRVYAKIFLFLSSKIIVVKQSLKKDSASDFYIDPVFYL